MPTEFCEQCGVTMDLHPFPDDPDDPGCETAEMKARMLGAFDRMIGRVVGR